MHLQCRDAKDDDECHRHGELVLERPVQPPHCAFPEGNADEHEVSKCQQEDVEGVFKKKLHPSLPMQLPDPERSLVIDVVRGAPENGLAQSPSNPLHDRRRRTSRSMAPHSLRRLNGGNG